jgi:hypothetical protein
MLALQIALAASFVRAMAEAGHNDSGPAMAMHAEKTRRTRNREAILISNATSDFNGNAMTPSYCRWFENDQR